MAAEAWTLYSPSIDYSVVQVALSLLPGSKVDYVGGPSAWEHATVTAGERELSFYAARKGAPDGKFGRILEGTIDYVRTEAKLPAEEQKRILDGLATVQWLVGIVPSPKLDEGAKALINALALRLGAKIFTGVEFIDPK